ncbi:hypothetical protein E2C01_005002 [Portunus trituberculatus]|uniref:Uncharacterized protein n=1 Tax=Portunus trituberculatus TaxID=210409 RepID=A0A5B7CR87_PORTR|nr:hypothetical protein [Portunus trituberculatus]
METGARSAPPRRHVNFSRSGLQQSEMPDHAASLPLIQHCTLGLNESSSQKHACNIISLQQPLVYHKLQSEMQTMIKTTYFIARLLFIYHSSSTGVCISASAKGINHGPAPENQLESSILMCCGLQANPKTGSIG